MKEHPKSWFNRSTYKEQWLVMWTNASRGPALAPLLLSQPVTAAKPVSTQFLLHLWLLHLLQRHPQRGCNNWSGTKEHTFKKAKTTTHSWGTQGSVSCCLTTKGIKRRYSDNLELQSLADVSIKYSSVFNATNYSTDVTKKGRYACEGPGRRFIGMPF